MITSEKSLSDYRGIIKKITTKRILNKYRDICKDTMTVKNFRSREYFYPMLPWILSLEKNDTKMSKCKT